MAYGSTPTDANSIPIGSGYVPNSGFVPLQSGASYTDGSSNASAPFRVETTPGSKRTYTYAVSATAPYATPTDWIVIRGAAGVVVKILHVEISGAATAATEAVWLLNVHTAADTGGTSTNPTPLQHDQNDSASTATVWLYSAAPTVGTSKTFRTARVDMDITPAASSNNPDRYVLEMSHLGYEPIVLRGVAQEFALNFGGAALPAGGVFDISITWTEE